MNRPSHKELFNKIREAVSAIADGRIAILNQAAVAADAIELGYVIDLELTEVLMELLDEVTPRHYAGTRPPQRSYEVDIQGIDIFPFLLESRRFNCRIYLKFALKDSFFWLVSLHQSKNLKE